MRLEPNGCSLSATLMERGSLSTPGSVQPGVPVDVYRGMSVHTDEGHMAGRVAAIVFDPDRQTATHLLLLREQRAVDYRLIPVELIAGVAGENVRLAITCPNLENLTIWRAAP